MRFDVDYGLIQKRSRCISSTYDKRDCHVQLERAFEAESKSSNCKNSIMNFFNECNAITNANKYADDCLAFIERAEDRQDSRLAHSLTEKFVNDILPYVDNVAYISEAVNKYAIGGEDRSLIYEAANEYKIADRILDNHEKISKRFNINSYIETSKHRDLGRIVRHCCEMVDTYDDLKPHAKMNICLEEVSYLLQKECIQYKKPELVKYVTEYFLTRSTETPHALQEDYKRVLNENSMIDDEDLSSVKYFMNDTYDNKSSIKNMLDKFSTSENKDFEKDFGCIADMSPVGNFMIPKNDFCHNISMVLKYIRQNLLGDSYDIKQIMGVLNSICSNIQAQMSDDTWNYNRDELSMILAAYRKEAEEIDLEIRGTEDKELISKLIELKDCYNDTINVLDDILSNLYTSYNIECMTNTITNESADMLYLNEFKVFKFNNLIRAAAEASKFMKSRGKRLLDKVKGIIKPKKSKFKKKSKLFDFGIKECYTTEGTVDICIETFDIVDETRMNEVHETLTEVCKEINDTILRNTDAKAYYKLVGESVEVHIENTTGDLVLSSAEENDLSEGTFSENDKIGILELEEMTSLYESMDIDRYVGFVDELKEAVTSLDEEHFNTLLEVSKYAGIDEEDMKSIYREYDYANEASYMTQKAFSNWKQEDAPIEVQIEAFNIMCSILESDDEKEKINKDKEKAKKDQEAKEKKESITDKIKSKLPGSDKDKESDDGEEKKDKNPFSGIKLNDLKLYTQGLKAKMKDLSNKEQEASRNLDMSFNHLYKGVKDALTNDRREGIITGSVIPSFSKCIKWGIALAGSALINPAIPCIAVVGGLAASKRLNKKERLLLMDEIDTELEVVEKELSIAESKNQMKKYRKLLQYQKELKRQQQRLKYNTRIGKDIMPGVTTGLKAND